MINFITGTVVEVTEKQIVLESQGIGYEISVSERTLQEKGKIGERVTILTHLALKEDGIFLYGFYCKQEKEMFFNLTSISGIGAKAGLSILSAVTLEELYSLIMTQNSKRLSEIKGIGKKTAERIVLELKDKIKQEYDYDITHMDLANDEAILALTALGFTRQEAISLISSIKRDNLTTEEIVLEALKNR